MTKNQKQMLKAVRESDNGDLFDVYKSFSPAKEKTYRYCFHECACLNGFNLRITSANTFSFCCGFLYYDDDKHLRCRYYTGQNTYDFIAE